MREFIRYVGIEIKKKKRKTKPMIERVVEIKESNQIDDFSFQFSNSMIFPPILDQHIFIPVVGFS